MLTDFQGITDKLIRDDAGHVSTIDRDTALDLAVSRYSQDKPRAVVEDVAAAADGYELPLPAAWETGFSRVLDIEYPLDEKPPALLRPDQWQIYVKPASTVILLFFTVNAAEQARVTYTRAHVLDATTDTVPTIHREAVCMYAAAMLADQLATFYSSSTDSTLSADAVAHRTKAAEFAARARNYRARYFASIGVTETQRAAHGVDVDIDQMDSRGRDRLTHPRRLR